MRSELWHSYSHSYSHGCPDLQNRCCRELRSVENSPNRVSFGVLGQTLKAVGRGRDAEFHEARVEPGQIFDLRLFSRFFARSCLVILLAPAGADAPKYPERTKKEIADWQTFHVGRAHFMARASILPP